VSKSYANEVNLTSRATIVVPTIDTDKGFTSAIQSWLACNPHQILVITTNEKVGAMHELASYLGDDRVQIYSVPVTGKRPAMVEGIRRTTTEIIVFVDDDVSWKHQTLNGLLAPFNNQQIGAVDVRQHVRPTTASGPLTLFESCGAARASRRNLTNTACAFFDNGQAINVTGRCAAYRTKIIQNDHFYSAFIQDFWCKNYRLKSGDGDFLTTWVVHNGWRTFHQNNRDFEVSTTMKEDWRYTLQLVRWSRNFARYFFRDIRFALQIGQYKHLKRLFLIIVFNYLSDIANMFELIVVFLTCLEGNSMGPESHVHQYVYVPTLILEPCNLRVRRRFSHTSLVILWSLLSTTGLELLENAQFILEAPRPFSRIPVLAIYGYVRTVVILYALCTLHKVIDILTFFGRTILIALSTIDYVGYSVGSRC
jgi:cellulose synthase/poly-beta-1,6-N-acetylglucosamine synthase-like glycosyltransferase